MKVKFSECVEYMIKGPFGSDMKKSLYVPQGENTYKVYIQGNALQKDEKLGDYYVSSEYFHQKLERFQVHPGDYLITCDGTLGKYIKLSDDIEPGVISSSLLLLKLDENKIYDKYFELLWEQSMLRYLASQARNACLVHLPSAKAIGDVEIVLPDMSIQKEIADKAFLIKAIIKKRNDELELLDELIKARFVELFGDLKSNNKGWRIVNFKECAEIDTNMIHDFEGYENYPHIGIDSIEKETGRLVGYRTISEDRVISGKYLFTPDHIIYSKIRPNLNKVAMPDFVGLCSADAYPVLVKANVCNREFLGYTLRSEYFLDYILAFSNRTNLPKVNKNQVEGFTLPLPPLELQGKFADFVKQTDKSKFDCFT